MMVYCKRANNKQAKDCLFHYYNDHTNILTLFTTKLYEVDIYFKNIKKD